MRYKSFLLVSIFCFSAAALSAQVHKTGSSHKKEHVDTIVVRKGHVAATGLPIALTMPKAYKVEPKVYKPVPLADSKSYYGDKSDFINAFVMKYLNAHNKTLNAVQNKSEKDFPLIDNVLQKNSVPKELKYLAVIESALNHNAVSRVGAVGPWQFMAPTARLMGLTVNKKRDDRKDIYKSTNAAAKYLTNLYEDLNDWLLVIAAYNSGPAPVKRAMERTGSNNFWDIKQYLPKETQGHVLAFIATATIFENLSKLIGKPVTDELDDNSNAEELVKEAKDMKIAKKSIFTPEELSNMAIIKLSDPISMDLLVQELGLNRDQMDKWNQDYDLFEMSAYSSESYNLRLPKDKLDKFLEKKEYLSKRTKTVFSAQNM